MHENRKFWVTTAIAITALLISIASTIVNEIRYVKNEQEAVYVTLKKFFGEYPISTTDDYSGIKGNGLINIIWEAILYNTGLPFTNKILPFNRMLSMLKNGICLRNC